MLIGLGAAGGAMALTSAEDMSDCVLTFEATDEDLMDGAGMLISGFRSLAKAPGRRLFTAARIAGRRRSEDEHTPGLSELVLRRQSRGKRSFICASLTCSKAEFCNGEVEG